MDTQQLVPLDEGTHRKRIIGLVLVLAVLAGGGYIIGSTIQLDLNKGSAAAGDLVGTCSGWPQPKVQLNWSKPTGSNVNTLLRADGTGPTDGSGTFFVVVPLSPADRTNYLDTSPLVGALMQYRIKHTPQISSNTVKIEINATNCGGVVTSVSPTTSPSPSPSTGAFKPGDIDRDGDVDIFDFSILVSNFGK
jgi:hypothetical protein